MTVKERYFNPFATTMDEVYSAPKPVQPERTLDEMIVELGGFKLTPEFGAFAARYHDLKTEVAEHLALTRSGKLEQLEDKHDAAILAVRQAKQALGLAAQERFKAEQEHLRLSNAYSNAVGRVNDLAA
jgi:hypothetical protein